MEDNRVGAAEARGSASGITAVRTRSELERLYRLSDNKNTEDSMLEDYVDSDKEEEKENKDEERMETGSVFDETEDEEQSGYEKNTVTVNPSTMPIRPEPIVSSLPAATDSSDGTGTVSISLITQNTGEAKVINLGQAYNTVKAARKAASSIRQLNQSPTSTEKTEWGGFVGTDGRVLQCMLVHDLRERLNKSLSFDPDKKVCAVCAVGGHPAFVNAAGGPVVLVGSDQCFPAALPCTDDGECLRIVRVEDGSLQEVLHALADSIGDSKLPDGTVFMLGSVSHLGRVGTAQYLTDWVRSRWWLKNRFGEKCLVVPLVPVPIQGIRGGGAN